MRKQILTAIIFTSLLLTSSVQAQFLEVTDGSEDERNHAITLEILGRCGFYSFNYDYAFLGYFAAGAGISYLTDFKDHAAGLPFYLNIYSGPERHRAFLSLGGTAIFGQADYLGIEPDGAGIMGVFGIGYEYRAENGFIIRVSPYLMVFNRGVAFWTGLSVGYTL